MQKSLGIASPLFGERTLDRGAFTARGKANSHAENAENAER
jgi:hypothetical protein